MRIRLLYYDYSHKVLMRHRDDGACTSYYSYILISIYLYSVLIYLCLFVLLFLGMNSQGIGQDIPSCLVYPPKCLQQSRLCTYYDAIELYIHTPHPSRASEWFLGFRIAVFPNNSLSPSLSLVFFFYGYYYSYYNTPSSSPPSPPFFPSYTQRRPSFQPRPKTRD